MLFRVSTAIATLAIALAGCGDTTTTDPVDSEFAAVIPTTEALEVSVEEEPEPIPPEIEDGATPRFDPSSFYEQAQEVAARVNAARETLQAHIDDIKENGEPVATSIEGRECAQWDQERPRYEARLTACRLERRARRYSFKLEGRPLGSEDEYLLLAAGRGRILEGEDNRAVAGTVGYNFDAARTVFANEGPTGRIAIGYRSARSVRQLRIAVDEVQWSDETEVRTAFHNYLHVAGRGGRLTYSRNSDFLAENSTGDFVSGQDGVREGGRVSLAWSRMNRARAAATVCGGTLGERCLRVVRCYSAVREDASYEDVSEERSASIDWDRVRCPSVEFDPEAPVDGLNDVEEPAPDADEIPGPDVEEPGPSTEES
ncbi:MAG: hypothetical protein AAF654_03830 [Myxococcota bacterium]